MAPPRDTKTPPTAPPAPGTPGRALLPERDRRRDPRCEAGILDLGSVQDADGDTPDGWTRTVTEPARDTATPGPSADAADWTAVVAPDLVEPQAPTRPPADSTPNPKRSTRFPDGESEDDGLPPGFAKKNCKATPPPL
ncbi:hypothetical protein HNR56_002580 [Roseospira marina]|nr:hypothetical protein [Roseospira marina]MBB5087880.1 hypothetical protein [Roseospira marina]